MSHLILDVQIVFILYSNRVFDVPAYLDTGTGTSEGVFNLLVIRGLARGEGIPGIEPESPDPQSSPLLIRHPGGRGSFSL